MKLKSRKSSFVMNTALGISFLVLAAACTNLKTAPERGSQEIHTRSVLPVPSGQQSDGNSGILLTYQLEFSGEEPSLSENGCRLRLVEKSSRRSTFVPLKPNEASVFVALEPGEYVTGRMGCGLTSVWNLEDVFAQAILVERGRASYMGQLIFVFENGDLTEVKKAPRAVSGEALIRAQEDVPGGLEIISAFTGRTISSEMIGQDAALNHFDVLAKGTDDADRVLQPLLTDLSACGTRAARLDPVRFGHLERTALYRKGMFQEIKSRVDQHAFSDELEACVEQSLKVFKPSSVAGELEVRVRY